MSEKTVISCDALDCHKEYEQDGNDVMIGDIANIGWLYVPESETHYCPSCKPKVEKELVEDGVEYIS